MAEVLASYDSGKALPVHSRAGSVPLDRLAGCRLSERPPDARLPAASRPPSRSHGEGTEDGVLFFRLHQRGEVVSRVEGSPCY
jgi:hypothetical protein